MWPYQTSVIIYCHWHLHPVPKHIIPTICSISSRYEFKFYLPYNYVSQGIIHWILTTCTCTLPFTCSIHGRVHILPYVKHQLPKIIRWHLDTEAHQKGHNSCSSLCPTSWCWRQHFISTQHGVVAGWNVEGKATYSSSEGFNAMYLFQSLEKVSFRIYIIDQLFTWLSSVEESSLCM